MHSKYIHAATQSPTPIQVRAADGRFGYDPEGALEPSPSMGSAISAAAHPGRHPSLPPSPRGALLIQRALVSLNRECDAASWVQWEDDGGLAGAGGEREKGARTGGAALGVALASAAERLRAFNDEQRSGRRHASVDDLGLERSAGGGRGGSGRLLGDEAPPDAAPRLPPSPLMAFGSELTVAASATSASLPSASGAAALLARTSVAASLARCVGRRGEVCRCGR